MRKQTVLYYFEVKPNYLVWSFGMVLFEMMTLDIPYRPSNSKKWFGIAEWIEKGTYLPAF